MSTVVALPIDTTALTVSRAAELFLDSLGNPNTIRGYATAVGKDRREARRAPAAGDGGRRRGPRGPGVAVGPGGRGHLERPPRRGGFVAVLVPGPR
ncbi:hypothetical protein AB0H34_18440 [Saccharopolyspora shandongensis]|uniref:hypothetical protein n=1 Tax=Saccharopolyspora shandongensis TaxID=418495 RepID=UPI00340EF37F